MTDREGVDVSKGKCAVESCERDAQARDWCGMHYQRWKKYGDASAPPRVHGSPSFYQRKTVSWQTQVERRTDKSGGPNGCWPWTGTIDRDGYGVFYVPALSCKSAHRLSYLALVGPIPEGMQLDHTCHDPRACTPGRSCRHRRCVNPQHLEPVTPAVNALRSGTAAAVNARKTICDQGHPLSGDNLVIKGKARYRQCRICMKARNRKYKARVRARALRDIPN